jgi:hypothetical protein
MSFIYLFIYLFYMFSYPGEEEGRTGPVWGLVSVGGERI